MVVRVRVRVRVRVEAVAAQAGQRVGRRPALGPEVVVVGGGRVLVGVVVQRLRRAGRLQAQLGVRGAGPASGRTGQRDPGPGQRGAEHPRQQLRRVRRVPEPRRAARVALELSPGLSRVCGEGRRLSRGEAGESAPAPARRRAGRGGRADAAVGPTGECALARPPQSLRNRREGRERPCGAGEAGRGRPSGSHDPGLPFSAPLGCVGEATGLRERANALMIGSAPGL